MPLWRARRDGGNSPAGRCGKTTAGKYGPCAIDAAAGQWCESPERRVERLKSVVGSDVCIWDDCRQGKHLWMKMIVQKLLGRVQKGAET